MALFTTYLAALRKVEYNPSNIFPKSGRCVRIVYVMRNRGNNEVAPTKETLTVYKEMQRRNNPEAFEIAKKNYLSSILKSEKAKEWIDAIAEESLFKDIILVCYEKDHTQCHRTILAQQIVFRHPEVNYVGELREFA